MMSDIPEFVTIPKSLFDRLALFDTHAVDDDMRVIRRHNIHLMEAYLKERRNASRQRLYAAKHLEFAMEADPKLLHIEVYKKLIPVTILHKVGYTKVWVSYYHDAIGHQEEMVGAIRISIGHPEKMLRDGFYALAKENNVFSHYHQGSNVVCKLSFETEGLADDEVWVTTTEAEYIVKTRSLTYNPS